MRKSLLNNLLCVLAIVIAVLYVCIMEFIVFVEDADYDKPQVIARPQGCYTLSGVYAYGFVTDESGHVWEYHDSELLKEQGEVPVVINFHGFGTPELEDDLILGLSCCDSTEAYLHSEMEDVNGRVLYQFKDLEHGWFWVFDADELGFVPVVGDHVQVFYADNGTDEPCDDELFYIRVL